MLLSAFVWLRRKCVWAVTLITGSALCGLLAQPVWALDVDKSLGAVELGPHQQHLEDPGRQLTLDDVLDAAVSSRFQPLKMDRPNFGFTESAHWLKVELRNQDPVAVEWILEIQYPMLDHVQTYLVSPDGQQVTDHTGDLLPFSARALKLRHPNVRLVLPPSATILLLVRVTTESSMQVPMTLWQAPVLAAQDHDTQYVLGVYYGILLAMFCYNLLLYVSIRDLAYLYYIQYIGGWALLQMALNGLAFEYLWPDVPWFGNRANVFFLFFSVAGMLQFARAFLCMSQHLPRLDFAMRALAWFNVLLTLATLCLPYAWMARLGAGLSLLALLLMICYSVAAWRRGVPQAKYFLIAWAAFMLGGGCFALKQFGVLPNGFLSTYGLQIGSAAEVILLSAALAYRMRLLKDENVRIQREAAELLEQRVHARTEQLNEALQELGSANEKLQMLSRTDALTGVGNRASFNEKLSQSWSRCMRAKSPLGLIMLDIDHFKAVNDTHGHLGGDACLMALAACLRSLVQREEDGCFRYGGEEFAILLPHTDQAGVVHLAQQVLQGLRDREIGFEGKVLRITASLGVACLVPEVGDSESVLIAQADGALYAAKAGGRDRIVVSSAMSEKFAE